MFSLALRSLSLPKSQILSSQVCLKEVSRSSSRSKRPILRALYNRRIEIGPEKERRRSEWSNWNYDSEIYAFGKRLNEEFDNKLLRQSFIHKSYVETEMERRKETLDVEGVSMEMEDNSALIDQGGVLLSDYVKAFLRKSYPYLLEEYICSVHDHIISTQSVANSAAFIGVKDLILSGEFPLNLETISDTFKSLVAVLHRGKDPRRAYKFINDFLLAKLIDQDINQMYTIEQPLSLLAGICRSYDMDPPQPRLLRNVASNTILACYHVGIYSGDTLLGESPGETPAVAEEQAAIEALKSLFGTKDNRAVISFLQNDDVLVEGQKRNRSVLEFHNSPLQ